MYCALARRRLARLPRPALLSKLGALLVLALAILTLLLLSTADLPALRFSKAHLERPAMWETGRDGTTVRPLDRCFVLGHDPGRPGWGSNSRAFCLISPVCFPPLEPNISSTVVMVTSAAPAECVWLTAGGTEVRGSPQSGCAEVRWKRVLCLYGRGWAGRRCPMERVVGKEVLNRLDSRGAIRWYEGLTVVVPNYAWTHNIFHFGRQWMNVARVVRLLRSYAGKEMVEAGLRGRKGKITVLFKMVGVWDRLWHKGFEEAVKGMLEEETGWDIEVTWLFQDDEKEFLCVRNAAMLGAEGQMTAFMFLNDSQVTGNRPVIPHEALLFKESMRKRFSLAPLVRRQGQGANQNDDVVIRVPPRTVGYLTRTARYRENARIFREEDEVWFQKVAKDEAKMQGLEFREIDFDANLTFAKQVELAGELGVAIGIHGANLVNSIFMPAGGALFEILPYHYARPFYKAGSNSGLRYASHELLQGKKHDCKDEIACEVVYRDTEIRLGEEDRVAVRKNLHEAFLYVSGMNERFPDGWARLKRLDGANYEIKQGRSGGRYAPPSLSRPRFAPPPR